MQFRDGVVWAGDNNAVSKSTDFGITWQTRGIFAVGSLVDIAFYNRLLGLLAGDNGIFRTTDGGQSWIKILTAPTPYRFNKVSFNGTASIVHAVAGNGDFYTSTDSGQRWSRTSLGNNINCRCFAVATDGTIYAIA